ncbi:MAG: hypothetical protein ACYCV0_16250 [Desulfitobacteriaceae bacterium]
MMRKIVFLSTVVILVLSLALPVFGTPSGQALDLSGIVQSTTTTVERQDTEKILVKEKRGEEVTAKLIINDSSLAGAINANGIEYQLQGTLGVSTEASYVKYEGAITNKPDLKFEAFNLGKNKLIVNIYGLAPNGDRINPFTVRLDGSKPVTSQKVIVRPISSATSTDTKSVSTLADSSGYDYFGGIYGWGFSMEAQGYRYQPSSTPYVVRLWTDADAPRNDAVQPYSTITRVNILQAQITKRASTGSTFQPVNPNADGKTSFTVPFTVKGYKIPIPVSTSTTSIDPDGFGNPSNVVYTWNFKDAYTYGSGNDSEGILAEHVYWLGNVQKNPYGYYESWVDGRIWYEVVGNYREYFNYGSTLSVWYN